MTKPLSSFAEGRVSVEGIINTGRLVKEALEELNHGQKAQLWEQLPFSESTGSRFRSIAEDHRIHAYRHDLPPAWRTIYELTKLDDGNLVENLKSRDRATRASFRESEGKLVERIENGW